MPRECFWGNKTNAAAARRPRTEHIRSRRQRGICAGLCCPGTRSFMAAARRCGASRHWPRLPSRWPLLVLVRRPRRPCLLAWWASSAKERRERKIEHRPRRPWSIGWWVHHASSPRKGLAICCRGRERIERGGCTRMKQRKRSSGGGGGASRLGRGSERERRRSSTQRGARSLT